MKSALLTSSAFAAFLMFGLSALTAQNDALNRSNFAIGSGIGYVNSVTSIQINNGSAVQNGGNTGYQLHLTPTIGYFLARNFVFGLGMDYLVNASEDNSNNTMPGSPRTSDTKLLFGPFTRVYLPFANDQALFLGAVYGYGKSETQISDGAETQTVNTSISTFGAGPGYAIFSNNRVSLDAQVKYNYGISRNNIRAGGTDQSTRTRTTSWDFVVGIHFYFNSR